MPSNRPCLVCGVLSRGSRCETHATTRWGQHSGTLGWDWTKTRNAYLKAHPYCEVCGLKATTVDHIKARAFGGTHEDSNLRSLCPTHAKAKDRQDSIDGKRRKAQGLS